MNTFNFFLSPRFSFSRKHLTFAFWFGIFMMVFFSPLRGEEKKKDALDVEFSGPLAVVPEMVMVGDPGNPADPLTGLGAVNDPFQIAKYPITVLQWSVFLNAINVVEGNTKDPRNLYHSNMFHDQNLQAFLVSISGIVKKKVEHTYGIEIYDDKVTLFFPKDWGTGTGHYYASLPMNMISLDDAKRYCNWLHNGCPFFEELNETTLAYTETGAYDFTNGKHGELMPGARYFIPTLNQSYKASYYQAGTSNGGYFLYPTQSNQLPYQTPRYSFRETNKTGANYALIGPGWPHHKFYYNEEEVRGMPLTTPVGLFNGSPGPYGTYDMGGNVRHWTSDAVITEEKTDYFMVVDGKISTIPVGPLLQPIAPGGSYDETSDQLLSKNAAKSFPSSEGKSTIGARICAREDAPPLTAPSDSETFIPDPSKETLFFKTLGNVAFAQITSYGLEFLLNGGRAYYEGKAFNFSELIQPFTHQRNIANTMLTVILAGTTTEEANHMNIQKADYWNISFIVLSTVVTMAVTEGGAFIVEGFIGECLKRLASAKIIDLTAQNTMEAATWQRLLLNGYYIGFNTYETTKSDLDYFDEQQKRTQKSSKK